MAIMAVMAKKQGTIKAPSNLNIQIHELATARALADAGYDVEFAHKTEGNRVTSADVIVNGVLWEMKSPQAGSRRAIERNLRKASKQSANIIFDSQRMKGISDAEVKRELHKYADLIKAIRRLWFVNCNREVIDIK